MMQDETIKLSFKPTKKWEKVIFDPQLLQLFFKVSFSSVFVCCPAGAQGSCYLTNIEVFMWSRVSMNRESMF